MKNSSKFCKNISAFLIMLVFYGAIYSCKKEHIYTLTGKIFVANEDNETISVIDAETKKEIKSIDIADGSGDMLMVHNVQVAPDGKTVWATAMPMSDTLMHQLIIIDPDNYTIMGRVMIGLDVHLAHVVFDNESKYAFATATEANKIFMVDTKTRQVIRSFNIGAGHSPHGMRYFGGKLYVANIDAHSLSIIDVTSGQVTEVPLGGVAIQTAVTKNGKYVFVSLYDTREVIRYTVQNGQLTKIPLPEGAQGPIQLYPTPDCQSLYVCDQGNLFGRPASNKVYVINIENTNVTRTITVGNAAHGVVVSGDGETAYVTNSADNTVSVIDIITNTVTTVIPVGMAPNGISYWYQTAGMP